MEHSDAAFHKMQEEAIRRVTEMQQRARSAVDGNVQQSPAEAPPRKKTPLGIDEEKALIGMLIYLLYKQGADLKLLLGLAYLLI